MLTLLQPSLIHSRSRRTGQALILAVLVMLFAVLLSTAFLVVIGNNGREVGREADNSEASRNADKGVAFVVARLRSSASPDTWDAKAALGPLPTTTADASLYYSQLDKAMGWDAQGFVKYPNPLTSRQAPQFMVSSHLVGTSDADAQSDGDKRFMLRITVIGLSSKSPELWSRRTLYKTTNWNGGTFSYANFVTSFDPDTQKPIVSKLASTIGTAPTANTDLDISVFLAQYQGNDRISYSPRIADVGNTLMISDGQHTPIVGIVKSSAPSGANNTLYNIKLRVLKTTTTSTFDPYSKVALVGSLFELPQQIDADGANNLQNTQKQNVYGVRPLDTTSVQVRPFGNGAQFNNGLNVPVTTTFVARPAETPATTTPITTDVAGQNNLTTDGPVSLGDPASPATPPQQVSLINVRNPGTVTPYTQPAAASNNQFLRLGYDPNGNAQADISDSAAGPSIAPRSIKPASLNFAAYRANAIAGATSLTGFYIPNGDDVEKFNGKPLTTSQLQRLWQRKSFGVDSNGNIAYTGTNAAIGAGANTTNARLCYARPGIDSYLYPMASGGLEAQGIRGWISPWEFLPRGAQVILRPAGAGHVNPYITIIRDPLSDGSTNAPDLNKAANSATRRFFEDIDPAVTGQLYLCAEGNIRVSGEWTGAPISIVSNNNIYIEGQVKAPVGRVALLAKKNVVLNPTQFVSRPFGTVDTSVGKDIFTAKVDATGGITQANGKNLRAASFKLGDKVAVFRRGVKSGAWYEVSAFDSPTNPTSFQFTTPLNTTDFPNGSDVKVKLASDPSIVLLKEANKTNGTATDDIPATEHFLAGADGKEANLQELDPALNAPNFAGASYAYKFSVGGDTFVRTVPFANSTGTAATVGVAFNQTAQKSIVKFTVRGGDDKNLAVPNPANEDDGVRQLFVRPSLPNKIDLLMKPKPGEIKGQDTFDLQDADGDGSPDATGDTTITLDRLNTRYVGLAPDADREKSRWRIEGVQDANGITGTGQTTTRRLAQGDLNFTITPNSKQDNGEEAPNEPTKFRVPLTSSILLFGGNAVLNTVAPQDATSLYHVGSAFGFRGTAINPATDEDQNSIKNAFYGVLPQWNIPPSAAGTQNNTVNYTQTSPAGNFAFTRDGAGDYDDRLPTYYLAGLRFQSVTGNTSIAPVADTTSPANKKTNMTIEVDATIYAEGGSWFVIPTPANVPANAGRGTDQQIEWRRPAYEVTINGNITQMMTPTSTFDYDNEPDPEGVAIGAMQRWTDTLSYQVTNGTTWQTISYRSAPLPALATNAGGAPVIDTTTGLYQTVALPRLPSSSDILYTYSN